MIRSICKQCGGPAVVGGSKPRVFCCMRCKAAWQRAQHPVSNEWLRAKYLDEGLSAAAIARIVGRDPKGVWIWLKGAGIPTRSRGNDKASHNFKPGQVSLFKGRHHTPEAREKFRQQSLADGRVPYLKDGKPYWKGKFGSEHVSWRGGVTPERQAFYSSDEWKAACKIVWTRADAKCERCGLDHRTIPKDERGSFHVHHIVSFMVRSLRAEPSNLALLCKRCHLFVHSRANANKELLAS